MKACIVLDVCQGSPTYVLQVMQQELFTAGELQELPKCLMLFFPDLQLDDIGEATVWKDWCPLTRS